MKVRSQDFSRCAHLYTCLTAQVEEKAEAEARATEAESRATEAESSATQAEDEIARLKSQLKATEESRRNERDEATVQVPMSRVLFFLVHAIVDCFSC